MTLTERIERRKPRQAPEPTPIRKPAWLRRMDEKGLPPKDQTDFVLGAFAPRDSDGAA
jgi:hypothetical protein